MALEIFFLLPALMVLVAGLAGAEKAPGIVTTLVSWQISNASVIDPGRTEIIKQGFFTSGYTVEATATGGDPLPQGRFEMVLEAFSPNRDMPGQRAGYWYVKGTWAIVDPNASPEAKKARHSPAVVEGTLLAELPFNPATTPGTLTATIRLLSLTGGRWNRSSGTFTGNEKFEGTIDVTLDLWPDMKSERREP